MKLLLNVSVYELENYLTREIVVDENIKVTDLCEYIIVSLNGEKIQSYSFDAGKKYLYVPYEESGEDKSLIGLTLKDFKPKKGKEYSMCYRNYYYDIDIKVMDIIAEEKYPEIDFVVLSGKGLGISDNMKEYELRDIFEYKKNKVKRDKGVTRATSRVERRKTYTEEEEREYLRYTHFDLDDVNDKILKYKEKQIERVKPKTYIFNVALEGFGKEIKRKIEVRSNIEIGEFCEKVILSMRGDLSHGYGMKRGKEFLGEELECSELYYLDLKEKQRLTVKYDYGDDWTFYLSLSKIINEESLEKFKVLSGKGYGIIDDCGGIWGLSDIFSGEDDSWGKYDINDFDLEKCNKRLQD